MTRAIALALALTGCSFAMTRGPRTSEPVPAHWPACTEHRGYVIGDTALAGLWGFATFVFVTDHDNLASLGAVVSIPATIAAGASAIYGLVKTQKCIDARDAYEAAAVRGT